MREYCDYAQTGRNVNRAQFQLMMEDARRGLFDYVVIYKVTRIMRNRDEMALARIMLRKSGVEILYAGEEIASGSSGVLQLGMLEVLAEYESAIDSERIRDGIQKNAERCMANGHTLYGWDIVDGRYVVNDREARVLRKMKNMLFAGSSVADIVRAVSDERSAHWKAVQPGHGDEAAQTSSERRDVPLRRNRGRGRHARAMAAIRSGHGPFHPRAAAPAKTAHRLEGRVPAVWQAMVR